MQLRLSAGYTLFVRAHATARARPSRGCNNRRRTRRACKTRFRLRAQGTLARQCHYVTVLLHRPLIWEYSIRRPTARSNWKGLYTPGREKERATEERRGNKGWRRKTARKISTVTVAALSIWGRWRLLMLLLVLYNGPPCSPRPV